MRALRSAPSAGVRLGRLDFGHHSPGLEAGASVRKIDVDDIAESVLGEIGDADFEPTVAEFGNPLVLGGVGQFLWCVHSLLPLSTAANLALTSRQ